MRQFNSFTPLLRVFSLAFSIFLLFINPAKSQTSETLQAGSVIINMGVVPQTIGNGIKPYGLIYDLVKNYAVPVKWIINPNKVKDGVDFTYNGTQYKGGTFIIPAEYRTAAVNLRITFWSGQGVVMATTTSPLSIDVYKTIKAVPRWTLDAANGAIAEVYLANAGITNVAFPGAYNWKLVGALDCCDDFFVMPHADPTWNTSTGAIGHGRLLSWNKDCLGSIWTGCHAGSALSNMVNPANRTQQTNFLVGKDPALTGISGNYTNSNSLLLWGVHSGGSVPYTDRLPADPISQFIGQTDLAQLNGSEQIYIPRQGNALTKWNAGANIIAYDPTQINVPTVDGDLRNAAALIVYGRGFDDPARGYVMMEACHKLSGGSVNDVAAQRAFLNFSFFQILPKAPQLSNIAGVADGQIVQSGTTITGLSISASSPLLGITFNFQWSSSVPGLFSNPNGATTNFTPSVVGANTTCVITCTVSDNCGRKSFQSSPITITPAPAPPVANNDNGTIANGCNPGTAITLNVLRNDTDPRGLSFSLTSLNQASASPANAGIWAISPDSSVTFIPDPNFNGTATIPYTITNAQGQTASATVSVTIGTADANGCSPNQVYAPSEVALIDLGTFVSQSGVGAALNGTALDAVEDTYTTAGTDYLNFGTNAANFVVLGVGSTSPLRAKDSINIYWSNGQAGTGTISVQIGQSSTGPWTNLQVFSNTSAGTGTAASIVSIYALPAGTSGITHVRISTGTASPATNSAKNVWLDAVEYEYLSCVSRLPNLVNDAIIVLEDAPTIIDVMANDDDPAGSVMTLKRVVNQPTNGKVSVNTDGTITYISNTDVSGSDVFTYEVCNAQGYCNTASVNITINDDACAIGNYKANPPGGAVTKVFSYQFAGTNAATGNPTVGNFTDAQFNQASQATNYGAATSLSIGKVFSSTAALRDVFYFNTSEIPTTAIVQSANFSLYRSGGGTTTLLGYLYGLSQSYVEAQTNWTLRSTGNNWTTAGGTFGSLISSTSITNSKIRFNWALSSTVQSWVTTPANNLGDRKSVV